jgi:hypothetical protein
MAKRELKQQQSQIVKPTTVPETAQPSLPLVEFEVWWATTAKKIPIHHRKEIVKADFMARGLSLREPAVVFNKALEQYGLKLK